MQAPNSMTMEERKMDDIEYFKMTITNLQRGGILIVGDTGHGARFIDFVNYCMTQENDGIPLLSASEKRILRSASYFMESDNGSYPPGRVHYLDTETNYAETAEQGLNARNREANRLWVPFVRGALIARLNIVSIGRSHVYDTYEGEEIVPSFQKALHAAVPDRIIEVFTMVDIEERDRRYGDLFNDYARISENQYGERVVPGKIWSLMSTASYLAGENSGENSNGGSRKNRITKTKRTRKARRAGSGQPDVDSVLSQKFRPKFTRGIGRRNLVNPHVGFSGNNNKGYGFTRNEISKEGTPNNILNAEYLAESRIDNTPTTPMVTKNVFSLTSAEAHKYAKLYQKYVRNNDAGADERFFNAIRKDNSLTNDSKAKLIKHFLASLEKGSELNIKFGILRLYKYANDLELM